MICMKLECPFPPPFGGVRGLDDPLMRDEDGEAAGGVPIGLCTRRHDAEDESPTKKKASPTKRKSKAAAKAASEEEETPVKSEADESADNVA